MQCSGACGAKPPVPSPGHNVNAMFTPPWPQGRNVLLRTARNDRRGFICKLADFGLSRMLGQEQTHVEVSSLIVSPLD